MKIILKLIGKKLISVINLNTKNLPSLSLVKQLSKETTEILEELKIKVMDFNIYDVFKGNNNEGDGEGSGVNADEFILLLKNLENKVFKKLEMQDDRMKKTEENLHQNEKNNKIQFAAINKAILELREDSSKFGELITQINQLIIDNRLYCESKEATFGRIEDLEEFKIKMLKEINK